MKVSRDPHRGGTQLPMFTPSSEWTPPSELPDLRRHAVVAVDYETRDDGLSAGRGPSWPQRAGHVAGVALAWPGGSAYAPVRHPDTTCFPREAVARWLADHEAAGVRFLYHNAHYDVGWARAEFGLRPGRVHDTMCAAVMLDETRLSYSLDRLAADAGLAGKDEALLVEAMTAYGYPARGEGWKRNLWRLPARFVGPYAEADAVATLALHEAYAPRLEAEGTTAAYELEMDLVPCVHEMRWRGVRVDVDRAAQSAERLRDARDAALDELERHMGREPLRDVRGRLSRGSKSGDMFTNRWLADQFDALGLTYPRTPATSSSMLLSPSGAPMTTAATARASCQVSAAT